MVVPEKQGEAAPHAALTGELPALLPAAEMAEASPQVALEIPEIAPAAAAVADEPVVRVLGTDAPATNEG